MFHENLLAQILDLPDAPLLMQEVNIRSIKAIFDEMINFETMQQ